MAIKWNTRWWAEECEVKNSLDELIGEVIKTCSIEEDEVVFTTESGKAIKLYHEQSCCESVYLEDYDGDEDDVVGGYVTVAEEVSDFTNPGALHGYTESYTWTFYKIETTKGSLWLRWYGSSNGWYSESVDVKGGVVV